MKQAIHISSLSISGGGAHSDRFKYGYIYGGAASPNFFSSRGCRPSDGGLVQRIKEVMLPPPMRRFAIDGEEGHARPEGRRDRLLHPGYVCLVDPRVQVLLLPPPPATGSSVERLVRIKTLPTIFPAHF